METKVQIPQAMKKKRIYPKRPRKPNSNWGLLAERVLTAIAELGPMTRAELCQHLSHDAASVSSVIARLRKQTPQRPQRVYVSGWVYDHEGMRPYPRAQFSLGAEPDKEYRRKVSIKRMHSDLQTAYFVRMKTASVFNLGMTREQLKAKAKEHRNEHRHDHDLA
jgi:hypothetical protein